MPVIIDYDLAPGTYYLRLWDKDGKITGNIGGLCVAVTPTISTKVNDQCDGAIAFPEIPIDGTCASVDVNTEGATGSLDAPLPGYNDDDLWYSFVVPDGVSRLLYEIKTNSGNTQHIVCLYDGCGSHASFQCSEFPYKETGEFIGLGEGFTYLLEVYTADLGVHSDFTVCLKTPPAAPVNDDCFGAMSFPFIPDNGNCASVSVNTTWATSSGSFACDQPENDLWYSFVMPSDATEIIAGFITSGKNKNEGLEIFENYCDTLVSIHCLDDYKTESLRISNLVAGQTYLLRTYTNDATQYEYELCLKIPPTPPTNDVCDQAIAFPEIPTDGTCANMTANTSSATGDLSDACTSVFDDDVWFSFVVPSEYSAVIVETTPLSSETSVGVTIYKGDCDHLSFIGCQEEKPAIFNVLDEGATYFVRAHTIGVNKEGLFTICIRVAPDPPANDECEGAFAFPDIPVNGQWVSVEGTTLAGTISRPSACQGDASDEVWLSFVVPSGQDRLLFRYNDDEDLAFELLQGDCDNLTYIGCYGIFNKTDALKNLEEGATYFLRVYNKTAYEFSFFKVEISVPQSLTNDLCEQALSFPPIPANGNCVSLSANTIFAGSSDISSCSGSTDDDVWFQFVAPDQYKAVLFSLDVTSGDAVGMQIFEGDCNNLIWKQCFISPNFDEISNLIPGETYWIQVYSLGKATNSSFSLCLSVPPLPPANDDCDEATYITNALGFFSDPGPQTTAGATNSGIPACFPYAEGTQDDVYDVWYRLVTDEDGGNATITIQFTYPSSDTYSFDHLHVQAFEGSCGDITSLSCLEDEVDINGEKDSTIVMNLYGLDPYKSYYIRVFPTGTSHNYVPVHFTVFAEGTAINPTTSIVVLDKKRLEIARCYPSPTHHDLNVEYTADEPCVSELYVTDLLGNIVQHKSVHTRQGDNHEVLMLNSIPSGLYFLFIDNANGKSQPARFVKE